MLTYSVAVHLGILWGDARPALLLLLGVVTMAFQGPLWRGRHGVWLGYLALLALGVLVWHHQDQLPLLYFPPVLINLAFGAVFGATLLPGATPIVTQFARILEGELDARAIWYTRRVTQAWTIFFGLLAGESLLLTLLAPPFVWSLFTNFI